MKKLLIIALLLISFSVFSVIVLRTPSEVLYLLNWGEYINEDLVAKFEKEYNCQVVIELATSSELMYQKIQAGTTSYDVAIPGDYVVRQLQDEGLLNELDVNNPEFENLNSYQTIFNNNLKNIMNSYMLDSKGEDFSSFYMPYFWGAYSIIYSTSKSDVESVVKTNGFKALYDRSLYQEDVKIGMYKTERWIVASYLMSKNLNPNITTYELLGGLPITTGDIRSDIYTDVVNILKTVKFDAFADDQLKRDVKDGHLDMCFTQLGDYFDALCFANEEGREINFFVSVPDTTAAFFDSMIIPKTSTKTYLANAFINFMLDPENAYENACAIGYCPTLKSVATLYEEAALAGEYYFGEEGSKNAMLMSEFLLKYPMYLDPLYASTNVYLFEPKSKEYLSSCKTIKNEATA